MIFKGVHYCIKQLPKVQSYCINYILLATKYVKQFYCTCYVIIIVLILVIILVVFVCFMEINVIILLDILCY